MLHIKRFILSSLVALGLPALAGSYNGRIFDAHLHYNDEATAVYSVGAVQELFAKNGVGAIAWGNGAKLFGLQ